MRSAVVLVVLVACAGDQDDSSIDLPLNPCAASDYIVQLQALAAAMDASSAPDVVAASHALQVQLNGLLLTPGCLSEPKPPSGSVTADCTPASCVFSVTTSSSDGDFVSFRGEITRTDDELTISLFHHLKAMSPGAVISTSAHANLRAPMTGHAQYSPEYTGTYTDIEYRDVEVDASRCPIQGVFDVTLVFSGASDPTSTTGRMELGPACVR